MTTTRRRENSPSMRNFDMSGDSTLNSKYFFLKTQRNKNKILYNSFFYVKDYTNAYSQYWRCEKRACKGRLVTTPIDTINDLSEKGVHNHVVSEEEKKKALFDETIKKLAETTQYKTSKVFSLASTSKCIYDLPVISKKTVYKHVQSIRKRNNISIATNVDLTQSNILTDRGDQFCFHDSGSESNSRMIIFTTKNNILHLKNSKICIVDGTFKVVPKDFYQLYAIHGQIFGKIFPLIYILMSGKTEQDYTTMINLLKEKLNFEFSQNIIMDFECAQHNAFKKATKQSSNIYFCMFHFGQCLWRKIQKLGLTKLYLENSNVRLLLKCFSSLSFVPIEHVTTEFEKIKEELLSHKFDNIPQFIQYFEKNFIISNKYPIETWNSYYRVMNDISLTSNSAELFHRHFYAKFDQAHSGLDTFVKNLIQTQSLVEQDINYIMCNPNPSKITKYARKMESIRIICQNYDKYYSTFFLQSITRKYNWKFD